MKYKHHIIPKHRIFNWFKRGIINLDTKKFLLKLGRKIIIGEDGKRHLSPRLDRVFVG